MKNLKTFAGVAVVLVGTVGAMIWFMQGSPCSDDIRGFEQTVSGEINYLQKEAMSISSNVSVSKKRKFDDVLKLTPASYGALRLCINECKFLERCMRFKFFEGPATGCPIEYKNYLSRVTEVLNLLERLEIAHQSTDNLVKVSSQINSLNDRYDIAVKSNGATGTGAMIILVQIKTQKDVFEQKLNQWMSLLDPDNQS
ncbi:MAG: hypothetical protein COC24_005230 [Alphaproteobacteria bacterium]|nr:hypothetical protein [Alphaproteobacteria bacterium]